MAFVTTKGRFSYAHVLKAHSINGGEPAYSVDLLIPKTDAAAIQKIQAEITRVFNEAIPTKFGGHKPTNWRSPLIDGDTIVDKKTGKLRPETAGHYVLRAKCSQDQPPEVVGADRQPIFSARDFKSGDYGRLSGNFYAYNNSGNTGISFGLNNVQKLAEGEAFDGRTSAENDFDDVPAEYATPAPAAPAYQPPVYPQPAAAAPAYPQYAAPAPSYQPPAPQFDPLTGMPMGNQILGL